MLPRKLWRSTLAAAALLLACGIVRAQDISVPEQIVDVMNKLWGKQQAGMRANHAKGVMVEGSFSPIKDGAGLSKAALFRGGAVPLIARFSDSTGLPNIPDADANA